MDQFRDRNLFSQEQIDERAAQMFKGQVRYECPWTALDQEMPVVIHTLPQVAYGSLVVHDGYVYAAYQGGVDRVRPDGTGGVNVVTFANTNDRPNQIVVEDDYLYYIVNYTPAFGRVPLSGSLPAVEEPVGAPYAAGLAADETAFYTTNGGATGMANGAIHRYPRTLIEMGTTMTPERVLDGQELPGLLVVLGDYLYFNSDQAIYRVLKTADFQTAWAARFRRGA